MRILIYFAKETRTHPNPPEHARRNLISKIKPGNQLQKFNLKKKIFFLTFRVDRFSYSLMPTWKFNKGKLFARVSIYKKYLIQWIMAVEWFKRSGNQYWSGLTRVEIDGVFFCLVLRSTGFFSAVGFNRYKKKSKKKNQGYVKFRATRKLPFFFIFWFVHINFARFVIAIQRILDFSNVTVFHFRILFSPHVGKKKSKLRSPIG